MLLLFRSADQGCSNWDYRFSWVRDSSFTIYILLRLGYRAEADAYMDFITERFLKSRGPDGALPIMFTIRGETEIPELELSHLDGYRGSKPVRIGNGAAFHQQFDIYGELMDAIYPYNKYGQPIHSGAVVFGARDAGLVLTIMNQPDMSIWEVRTTSRTLPTPRSCFGWPSIVASVSPRSGTCHARTEPTGFARGRLSTEEIMEKGYNKEMKCFVQSLREQGDAGFVHPHCSPGLFYCMPNDPRFINTMDRILLPPEKEVLTSTGLVYRV